jgi:hypothetical protein
MENGQNMEHKARKDQKKNEIKGQFINTQDKSYIN